MGGRRNSAGRAVVLSSFLMGGPSGSGVATTVTIGTVAYPLLEKAGYDKNAAGGLLAAGGLGAIISPPVLGAAAFLIAEFLKISYFDVIVMATIPTVLYYFAILVMVEVDARKQGGAGELLVAKGELWRLTKGYWFHFGSLISIIVFMLLGFSPVLAVFWATVLAIAASALRSDTAIVPWWAAIPMVVGAGAGHGPDGGHAVRAVRRLWLAAGVRADRRRGRHRPAGAAPGAGLGAARHGRCGRAPPACSTSPPPAPRPASSSAWSTLTGLAQRFADIIIGYAQGSLLLTAMFTAMIVWLVGLAVPVTASYIMCAVIAAPAMIKLGVPDFAAHMFIFYYAVLSEVSPPTALSPFAAAAITGGNPYITTLQSWKYTMPAFLVPFVFVLDPQGIGLLLKVPKGGGWLDIVEVVHRDRRRHRHAGLRGPGLVPEEEQRAGDGAVRRRRPVPGVPGHPRRHPAAAPGLDIGAFVPGLSDLGLRVGWNVPGAAGVRAGRGAAAGAGGMSARASLARRAHPQGCVGRWNVTARFGRRQRLSDTGGGSILGPVRDAYHEKRGRLRSAVRQLLALAATATADRSVLLRHRCGRAGGAARSALHAFDPHGSDAALRWLAPPAPINKRSGTASLGQNLRSRPDTSRPLRRSVIALEAAARRPQLCPGDSRESWRRHGRDSGWRDGARQLELGGFDARQQLVALAPLQHAKQAFDLSGSAKSRKTPRTSVSTFGSRES